MDNVVDLSTITSGRELKQWHLAYFAKRDMTAYYKGFAAGLRNDERSRRKPLDYHLGYEDGRKLCRC